MQSDRRRPAGRIQILDGWRASSILLVLAGHWLPLGPSAWQLNAAVAAAGMALFFCLSGFLIAHFLLIDPSVRAFLVRRVFRIVPLGWGAMAVLAIVSGADAQHVLANLFFYANLPEAKFLPGGHHLWSLCVEVQFYAAVAILVGLAGRRGLYVLPVVAVFVTALRVVDEETISIVTWHRVDEILAGSTLALVLHRWPSTASNRISPYACFVALAFLVASGNPLLGELGYLRPYFGALAVGLSLYSAPTFLTSVFESRAARYVAATSYSVYVIHGMLTATWLGGEGASKIMKYVLRAPLALLTFLLAHISTFYYEKWFIELGKSLLVKRTAVAR